MKKQELEQLIETIVRKELGEALEDTRLPSNVQTFLTRVKEKIEKVRLNKTQQMAAILQLVTALGIDKTQFNSYMSRIKQEVPA